MSFSFGDWNKSCNEFTFNHKEPKKETSISTKAQPMFNFGANGTRKEDSQIDILKEIRDSLKANTVEEGSLVIHEFSCNNCKSPQIKGVRYKCFVCEDYDLCSTCEKSKHCFHSNCHVFLKIEYPFQQEELTKNNIQLSYPRIVNQVNGSFIARN